MLNDLLSYTCPRLLLHQFSFAFIEVSGIFTLPRLYEKLWTPTQVVHEAGLLQNFQIITSCGFIFP